LVASTYALAASIKYPGQTEFELRLQRVIGMLELFEGVVLRGG
jgi:hypothetical protein